MDFGAYGQLKTNHRKVRFFNLVNGDKFHRILYAKPNTWTIFAHGARERVKGKYKKWFFVERNGKDFLIKQVEKVSGEWWKE